MKKRIKKINELLNSGNVQDLIKYLDHIGYNDWVKQNPNPAEFHKTDLATMCQIMANRKKKEDKTQC